jgi:hypothetical protein
MFGKKTAPAKRKKTTPKKKDKILIVSKDGQVLEGAKIVRIK